jgi:hypothetical protein
VTAKWWKFPSYNGGVGAYNCAGRSVEISSVIHSSSPVGPIINAKERAESSATVSSQRDTRVCTRPFATGFTHASKVTPLLTVGSEAVVTVDAPSKTIPRRTNASSNVTTPSSVGPTCPSRSS